MAVEVVPRLLLLLPDAFTSLQSEAGGRQAACAMETPAGHLLRIQVTAVSPLYCIRKVVYALLMQRSPCLQLRFTTVVLPLRSAICTSHAIRTIVFWVPIQLPAVICVSGRSHPKQCMCLHTSSQ